MPAPSAAGGAGRTLPRRQTRQPPRAPTGPGARVHPGAAMTAAPPLLAERALALAVGDPEWRDAILGDLREEFLSMARRHGLPYARRWYWTQAVGVVAHRAVAPR